MSSLHGSWGWYLWTRWCGGGLKLPRLSSKVYARVPKGKIGMIDLWFRKNSEAFVPAVVSRSKIRVKWNERLIDRWKETTDLLAGVRSLRYFLRSKKGHLLFYGGCGVEVVTFTFHDIFTDFYVKKKKTSHLAQSILRLKVNWITFQATRLTSWEKNMSSTSSSFYSQAFWLQQLRHRKR